MKARGGQGGPEAGQRVLQRVPAGDGGVLFPVQSVQAQVHGGEPGIHQVGELLRQQNAVGGEGDTVDTVDGPDAPDQVVEALAGQRLAAGEADLADARRGEKPAEPDDLLVGEHLGVLHPLHPLRGHAVDAAQVAPVGDRDAQIVDGAAVSVDHSRPSRFR